MIKIFLMCYTLLGLKLVWDYSTAKPKTKLLELFLLWLAGPGVFLAIYIGHTYKILKGVLDGSWIQHKGD